MIDKLTIDRIYAAADIVEVVSDFVTLKKKGANYTACCPFHNEKTPSFVVTPSKGIFKCFGCSKGGNAVTFVMEHESMTYPEALKYVAKKYGIEVEDRELTEQEQRVNDDRESMMVVTGAAAEFFARTLHDTAEGKAVGMSYFKKRGFTDETIRHFMLGFSPEKNDAFSTYALENGYKQEFLVSTGLSIEREQGGLRDRFTGRVIFPIHSLSGRIVGFGGRTLRTDKAVAKYLNSPESTIYHKSDLLYGLFQAKNDISREDACILVEGYTDVLQMHQAGVKNVVASSGTALTQNQIRLISRFTRNITVIYDGDPAGIKASLRGIDMILEQGLNVRVVLLPEGEDPDSFAKSNPATRIREFIADKEEDFLTFKTKVLLSDAKGDPIKKAALITDIVDSIALIPAPIARSVYIKECASLLDIDEAVLVTEVAKRRVSATGDRQTQEFLQRRITEIKRETQQPVVKFIAGGSTLDELEKEIVKYLLKYGSEQFEFTEGRETVQFGVAELVLTEIANIGAEFTNPVYKAIFNTYSEAFAAGSHPPAHTFINHPDPGVCNAAVEVLTADDNYIPSELWKRMEAPPITEKEILSVALPRAILLYKSKVIKAIIEQLKASLSDPDTQDEDKSAVMQKIDSLNRELTKISKHTNRIVL